MTAANANTNAENETKTRTPLEPRVIFMIVAGVCLVSLLLWFMLHFKARQQQLQDINDQIESSTTQLSDLQNKQAQIPQLTKAVDDMKKRQAVLVKALPATSEMGQYLDTLRSTVAASGATLDSLTVSPGEAGNGSGLPAGVKPQKMDLILKGNFNSIYKALQGIETTSRFTKLQEVNMISTQDPAKAGVEPDVKATISMTTYTFDPAAAPPAGAAPAAATPAPAAGGKS